MEDTAYAIEAAVEESHWWFVARRRLLAHAIAALAAPRDAPVLDIGTGTGSNLRLLRALGFANTRGLDISDAAIEWCATKGLGTVIKGDVCHLPFDDNTFRLVLATDVVEHVDDDLQALREIARVITSDGHALITVPAFRVLWGLQDDVAHHKRRYARGELEARISQAGLVCENSFHFNFLLFAPIFVARRLIRWLDLKLESENQINSPVLNRILLTVFSADIRIARWLRPSFGASFFAIVRRPVA